MLINEFSKPVTLESLNENLAQRFGQKIDVSKFTREQLEDARNKLRTQISQIETNESYEAVNTDSYQKSKLFLDIINQAIDEMDSSSDTTPETEEKIVEGAEEQSALVMAAKDMVTRVTSWMEDTAEMQTESMLELADAIRDEMGQSESDAFVGVVKPALESMYTAMESTREALTNGVGMLTGEGGAPAEDMGAEPADDAPADDAEMEPTVDQEEADAAADEFAAADAATGGEEEAGREKRESKKHKKKMIETSRRLGTILSKKK